MSFIKEIFKNIPKIKTKALSSWINDEKSLQSRKHVKDPEISADNCVCGIFLPSTKNYISI